MLTPEWEAALHRAAEAPVVMVIGESDTGKTTFVTALANAAVARGLSVGIVDADLGQSEVGPPTTVGLGRPRSRLSRPADAEILALEFVGVTSPARNVLGTLVATRRLVDRARAAALDRVIVDTSGLVAGGLGRALKQAKIELVAPEIVVCLERAGECAGIVGPYLGGARPIVVRLRAAAVSGRSADERRRYREQRLALHLAGAVDVALPLSRVRVRLPGGEMTEDLETMAGAAGLIAGLEDDGRATLGLAVVGRVDVERGSLHVLTAVAAEAVATVKIGRERYE
jgi:polynucleotide 5'-hydroxyl-kinase GRC3/NOL9